jgi:hypothetical protein
MMPFHYAFAVSNTLNIFTSCISTTNSGYELISRQILPSKKLFAGWADVLFYLKMSSRKISYSKHQNKHDLWLGFYTQKAVFIFAYI